MWYAIVAHDHESSLEARYRARPEHLQRLKALQEEGRLLLAGPFPAIEATDPGASGFTGSLIVAEFPSLTSARAWAEDDPYQHAGVYQRIDIRPFRKTLP